MPVSAKATRNQRPPGVHTDVITRRSPTRAKLTPTGSAGCRRSLPLGWVNSARVGLGSLAACSSWSWSRRSRSPPTSAPASRSSTGCALRARDAARRGGRARRGRAARRLLRRAAALDRLHERRPRAVAALRRRARGPRRAEPRAAPLAAGDARRAAAPRRRRARRRSARAGLLAGDARGRARRSRAQVATAHCEAAERLGARIGVGEPVPRALRRLFERWDGKGVPRGLAGEAIPLPARFVQVAYDAALLADAARARGGA